MEKLTNVEREVRKESANAYCNAEKKKKRAGVPQDLIDIACTYSGESNPQSPIPNPHAPT